MDSDEEFQFESDDDGWGDQQEEDEETIKIENTFYEADDNKRHDPQKVWQLATLHTRDGLIAT